MKTKKEIEEKLEMYYQIRDNALVFTSDFILASGAITALEWILEKE